MAFEYDFKVDDIIVPRYQDMLTHDTIDNSSQLCHLDCQAIVVHYRDSPSKRLDEQFIMVYYKCGLMCRLTTKMSFIW